MVSIGCKFVGHGLKKDFNIINIQVPSNQVLDTVEIFHKPRSRKIALRFLASYLLNIDIQSQTHDSIEDAMTAFKVYKKYQELHSKGKCAQTLEKIYNLGERFDWKSSHQRKQDYINSNK